jgi:hypothetical protein
MSKHSENEERRRRKYETWARREQLVIKEIAPTMVELHHASADDPPRFIPLDP